jgi:hypothetical protein
MQGLPSPLPQGQPPPPPPWQHPPQLRARTEFQLLRALRRYHERAHHHHHRCRERARRRHRPRAPLGPRRSGRGPVVDHVLLCRTLLRRAWQRRTRVEGGGGAPRRRGRGTGTTCRRAQCGSVLEPRVRPPGRQIRLQDVRSAAVWRRLEARIWLHQCSLARCETIVHTAYEAVKWRGPGDDS